MLDANTNTMDELLRRGDIALYRAKREGKGQCVVYKPAMDNEDAGLTASAIEEALRSDEFYLVYQPICDSATRQVRSVEALLRWRHPKRGLVGPSEFIPVAERSSVIHELGAWVLERACKDAASWPQDVQVAVNLSPKQFERPDQLRTAIRSALQTSGLRARRLIVEITESVLLQQDRSIEILQPIQDEGLTIALDDFGKGYASLDYLRRFRFDKLKIDRSFIADMATSAHCATIVSGILELSRRLGIHTVAEGVEASGQIAELCELGCSEVQGFAIGEPVRRDLVPTFFRLKAPDETSRQAN